MRRDNAHPVDVCVSVGKQKGPKRSRKLTPTDGQFIVQAQACGLSQRAATELWATQLAFAAAIVAEPHRRAEIEAAADRALREAVAAANAQRAA